MSRDHRRFRAFHDADALVVDLYRLTRPMPAAERFGLQAQLRRAGVSVPANIVEGSARTSTTEYCRFLEVAHASARECSYLLDLAGRLDLIELDAARTLATRYQQTAAAILSAVQALQPSRARG